MRFAAPLNLLEFLNFFAHSISKYMMYYSFEKSNLSLSLIEFIEKYIKIHNIKSVLLASSWNDFFLFNTVDVDIFGSELGQS